MRRPSGWEESPLGWARTLLTVPRGFCVGSSKQERTPQGGPCFSWAVSVAGCAYLFPHGLEVRVSQQNAPTWTCSPCTTWESTQEEVPPGWGCPTRLGWNHRQARVPVVVCAPNWSAPGLCKAVGDPAHRGKQWEEMETTIRV